MEHKDKLLPCQRAMLATREDVNGWRVYHCETTRLACVISGAEPDRGTLELACEELGCNKERP